MSGLLMCISIMFAVLNSCLLHKFSNRGLDNTGDIFLFNGAISAGWCLILLVWSLCTNDLHITPLSVLYGVVYGIILCMFLLFKTLSMATGSVSLTTLIGSCAFLIATAYSVLFTGDTISVWQIVGVLILLPALYLCMNPKVEKSHEKKYSKQWFIYCFVFFLAGGGVGILYRIFGKSSVSDQVNGMMLSSAVVASLLFYICGFIVNRINRAPAPKLRKTALKYTVLCAVTSCFYIRLNITLSNIVPGAIFFSVINGSMVMLTALAGRIFFGENLKPVQVSGLLLGLAAIIIIGCC